MAQLEMAAPAAKLARLTRDQRSAVLRKVEQVLDNAGDRALSPAEVGLLDELAREAEVLDDRARRFQRVALEERDRR